MQEIGKVLILIGILLVAVGSIFIISGKVPFLGRLPGDILIQRKNFTLYFPIVTSILISIIITFLFWLIGKR